MNMQLFKVIKGSRVPSKFIVLFESLSNCKKHKKGNFTSKSNSNKIMLCVGGGQHHLVLNKISTL